TDSKLWRKRAHRSKPKKVVNIPSGDVSSVEDGDVSSADLKLRRKRAHSSKPKKVVDIPPSDVSSADSKLRRKRAHSSKPKKAADIPSGDASSADLKLRRKQAHSLKPKEIVEIPSFNNHANARLQKGPSARDGPGYTYVLQGTDFNCFKIGMSKSFPESRRIPDQERNNGEKYTVKETFPVSWRYTVDTIIKRQLAACALPDRGNDGGSEWFRGSWEQIREVIELARKAVQQQWEGEEPSLGL
ncbi:hypothetical protein HDU90_001622, partial [Geranomyces variabilis]